MLVWDGSAIAATAAERSSADRLTPQHWKVPGSVEVDISTATIDLRLANGETDRFAAAEVSEAALFAAIPWRTFGWYKGQRHYSGSYWAATVDNHVIYESRLELSSLLMADFDVSVLVPTDPGSVCESRRSCFLLGVSTSRVCCFGGPPAGFA